MTLMIFASDAFLVRMHNIVQSCIDLSTVLSIIGNMTISISKVGDTLIVELAQDAQSKPLKQSFSTDEIRSVVKMLSAAADSQKFSIKLEF